MRVEQEGKRLVIRQGIGQLWIDAWGRDSVRIRMTSEPEMDPRDWALTERRVYLPAGAVWKDAYTGKVYDGGQTIDVPAPIDIIPVMLRDGKDYPIYC